MTDALRQRGHATRTKSKEAHDVDVLGAATMSERLQQPFAVDNRPGANSFIAAKAVSSASPDGYAQWLSNMRHHLSGRPG
ncbi:tripartite tricarboxylate transporter substrate-binding protein [Cupriavidus basilensis]